MYNNSYIKNDFGTMPQFCQGCGEGQNYEMYTLQDGFVGINSEIEQLCQWCVFDYIREYGH